MAVKIKLMRLGKIRHPQYRIVVADARTKREGRSIETIGKYHPMQAPSYIEVDSERAQYWLGVGAQPTEPVKAIFRVTGDWQKFKGEPGAEGTLRHAEPKPDKFVAYEALTKALMEQAEKEAPKSKKTLRTQSVSEGTPGEGKSSDKAAQDNKAGKDDKASKAAQDNKAGKDDKASKAATNDKAVKIEAVKEAKVEPNKTSDSKQDQQKQDEKKNEKTTKPTEQGNDSTTSAAASADSK